MTEKNSSEYLVNLNQVDDDLKHRVSLRVTPKGIDGERLVNDKNEPVDVKVISAKQNGSYTGRIVANEQNYLIQAIGKREEFAIVHNKEQVAIQGANLKKLDKNDRLNFNAVQIHYKQDQAKMYPWDRKKHEVKIEAKIKEQEAAIFAKERSDNGLPPMAEPNSINGVVVSDKMEGKKSGISNEVLDELIKKQEDVALAKERSGSDLNPKLDSQVSQAIAHEESVRNNPYSTSDEKNNAKEARKDAQFIKPKIKTDSGKTYEFDIKNESDSEQGMER